MGEIKMYDIAIIGAGVVGAAIARELSRYELKIALIEKAEDVATGASKANSGIVHGGYSAKYGTLKGKLCHQGNGMYDQLNKELNFGFRRPGALIIAFSEEDRETLQGLYDNGMKVGNTELELIERDEIIKLEPHINPEVLAALHCKTVGVVSPYEFTIALAENAIQNGVDLFLENEVLDIIQESVFTVRTNKMDIQAKYVINAAGVYGDRIAQMLGVDHFKILPRRGQYVLMGKDQQDLVHSVIFQVPTQKGKGILVTTTYHGNFMIGPDAEDIQDKEDKDTSIEVLRDIVKTARLSIPDFEIKKAITTFSGVRAMVAGGDFIIEESAVKGFINVAGIDSPGLTSSPAIALMVVDLLKSSGCVLTPDLKFNPYRKPLIQLKTDTFDGSIDNEKAEKNIICRCEKVTEAEIIEAMRRGIPVHTTDAVKRRVRAGMGFCQGNFCRERVKKLIARELGIEADQVEVRGRGEIPKRVAISEIRKLEV